MPSPSRLCNFAIGLNPTKPLIFPTISYIGNTKWTLDILQVLETEIDVNNNEDIFANKYVVQEKISDYKDILLAFGN